MKKRTVPDYSKSLNRFKKAMELQLVLNSGRGGWAGEKYSYLFERLRANTEQLIEDTPSMASRHVYMQKVCADVANFAMFIFDRIERDKARKAAP